MQNQELIYSLEQLDQAVELLYSQLSHCSIVTFEGALGAGKTTLVRALLRRCGVMGVISSPTFTYVNVYENEQGQVFYHFDLYRIKSVNEFLSLGFDEYLHMPNSWVFIEWPEVIAPLLIEGTCYVKIDYQNDRRVLSIEKK